MILAMKNKYIIRSRISEVKTREILKLFCLVIEVINITTLSNTYHLKYSKKSTYQ